MSQSSLSTHEIALLKAAGISPEAFLAARKAKAKAAKAKAKGGKKAQVKGVKAAKKACYEKRMVRVETSLRGGIPSTVRLDLAEENKEVLTVARAKSAAA